MIEDDDTDELPDTFIVQDFDDEAADSLDVVPIAVRGEIARELLQPDGFGHVGEIWDRGYEDRKKPARTVREICALCGWPISLRRRWSACEFPRRPGVWWRGDHWEFCRCHGCLCPPFGSVGRPKYCSDECRHRIKLAFERGHRRAEGAKSWSFDDDADRLVNYRFGIRELVAQRIASDHYPRW